MRRGEDYQQECDAKQELEERSGEDQPEQAGSSQRKREQVGIDRHDANELSGQDNRPNKGCQSSSQRHRHIYVERRAPAFHRLASLPVVRCQQPENGDSLADYWHLRQGVAVVASGTGSGDGGSSVPMGTPSIASVAGAVSVWSGVGTGT